MNINLLHKTPFKQIVDIDPVDDPLLNIYNILNNPDSGLKDSKNNPFTLKSENFDEWKNIFTNNPDIQSNVFDILYNSENYKPKANNLEQFQKNVLGDINNLDEDFNWNDSVYKKSNYTWDTTADKLNMHGKVGILSYTNEQGVTVEVDPNNPDHINQRKALVKDGTINLFYDSGTGSPQPHYFDENGIIISERMVADVKIIGTPWKDITWEIVTLKDKDAQKYLTTNYSNYGFSFGTRGGGNNIQVHSQVDLDGDGINDVEEFDFNNIFRGKNKEEAIRLNKWLLEHKIDDQLVADPVDILLSNIRPNEKQILDFNNTNNTLYDIFLKDKEEYNKIVNHDDKYKYNIDRSNTKHTWIQDRTLINNQTPIVNIIDGENTNITSINEERQFENTNVIKSSFEDGHKEIKAILPEVKLMLAREQLAEKLDIPVDNLGPEHETDIALILNTIKDDDPRVKELVIEQLNKNSIQAQMNENLVNRIDHDKTVTRQNQVTLESLAEEKLNKLSVEIKDFINKKDILTNNLVESIQILQDYETDLNKYQADFDKLSKFDINSYAKNVVNKYQPEIDKIKEELGLNLINLIETRRKIITGDPMALKRAINILNESYQLELESNLSPINEKINNEVTLKVDEVNNKIKNIQTLAKNTKKKYDIEFKNYEAFSKEAVTLSNDLQNILPGLLDKEEELKQFFELIGKDYRLLPNLAASLSKFGLSLGEGLIGLTAWGTDGVLDLLIDKNIISKDSVLDVLATNYNNGASWVSEQVRGLREGYFTENFKDRIRFDDCTTLGDYLEWALHTGAEYGPQLALMYFSMGGSTALGLSTKFAQRFSLGLLSSSEIGNTFYDNKKNKALYIKTGGVHGYDYTPWQMFWNPLVHGVAEYIFERFTFGQVRKFRSALNTGGKFQFNRALTRSYWEDAKWLGLQWHRGGTEEFLTTFTTNLSDINAGKDIHWSDNLKESYASGAVISWGLTTPYAAKLLSPFRSTDTNQRIGGNFDRITTLLKRTTDPNISSELKIELNKEIAALLLKNEELYVNDIKRFSSFTNLDKRNLLDIEKNIFNIRKAATKVNDDVSINPKDKEIELKILQNQINENDNNKDNIINKYSQEDINENYKNAMRVVEDNIKEVNKQGIKIAIEDGNNKDFIKFQEETSTDEVKFDDGTTAPTNTFLAGLVESLKNIIKSKTSTKNDIKNARIELNDLKKVIKNRNNIIKGRSSQYGAITLTADGFKIFVNKETAIKNNVVTGGAHEFFHALLYATLLQNQHVQTAFGKTVLAELQAGIDAGYVKIKKDSNINERIQAYTPEEGQGEEVITILSEAMINDEITFHDSIFSNVGKSLRRFSQRHLGTRIKFNNSKQVFNFLRDYSDTIKSGRVINKSMMDLFIRGGKGKLIQRTKDRKTDPQFSKNVSRFDTPQKIAVDKLALNADGTRMNKAQWDNEGLTKAYTEMMDGKVLDGLILKGIEIDKKNPNVYGKTLDNFIEGVKGDLIGTLMRFNPEINDSLSGWVNNQINFRKGDILKEFKKETGTTYIDVGVTTTAGDVLASQLVAEKDVELQRFEEMDITKARKEVGLPTFLNTIDISKTAVNKINQIVADANIDIKNLTYKDVKKLLTGKNAPLTGVMDAITDAFGIPTSKIINNKDLDSKQRVAAQEFIKNNTRQLISMLPEGNTVSGKATGVSPTLLKNFYNKGERVKMARTGSAQGLPSQIKQDDIKFNDFRQAFGIMPDGKNITNTSKDGIIRALAVQAAMITANQSIRQNAIQRETDPVSVIALVGDGKSATMFAKLPKIDNKKKQLLKYVGAIDSVLSTENQIIFWNRINQFADILIGNKDSISNEIAKVYEDVPGILLHKQRLTEMLSQAVDGFKLPKRDVAYAEGVLVQKLLELNARQGAKVRAFTGSNISNTAAWKIPMRVKRYKAVGKLYVSKTWNPNKPAESIREILQLKGHTATSSRANHLKRSQPYPDTKDFLKNTLGTIPGLEYKLNKSGGLNTNSIIYKDKKIDGVNTTFASQNSGPALNDVKKQQAGNKKNINKRRLNEKEAILADVKYVKFLSRLFNNGYIDNVDLMMHMSGLLSNMQSVHARAASLKHISEDAFSFEDPGAQLKVEHMQQRVNKLIDMFHQEINLDGINLKKATEHFKNYRVAIIPNTMDDALRDNKLGDALYKDQTLEDPPENRYHNPVMILDKRTVGLLDIDNNLKPNKYSEAFMKAKEVLANQGIEIKDFKIQSNMMKFSKPATEGTKGVSIWDFDDTLAKTKSGVIAKIPNPDMTPKPGRKVIFLAGGAGSGKSNVIKQLDLKGQGFKVINSDKSLEWLKRNNGLPANMNDLTPVQAAKLGKLQWEARQIASKEMMNLKGKGDGIVVDSTGGSLNVMEDQLREFKDKGYDVQMIFVETSLETALARNKARKERSLLDKIVIKNHEKVQGNKKAFKELFDNNFTEVKTDKLKQNDPMPIKLVDKVDNFTKSYENRRLIADEFATEGKSILDQGGEFDFFEFNKVIEGEKGPLFGKAMSRAKKFGTKDQFILTARPLEAAPHIHEFLKSQGLYIPLKNITALANSTAKAKATWIADNIVAKGYNDIYFADDALANVEAVDNILEQFDVKRNVQQAKIRFSKTAPKKVNTILAEGKQDLDSDFNIIIEEATGVIKGKEFSAAKARQRGRNKGRFKFFIPPSAEDFAGLIYSFLGKGEIGEAHHKFFKENLFDIYGKAIRGLNLAKQSIANDMKALKKDMPNEFKSLEGTTFRHTPEVTGTEYTYGQAARVYLWDKNGYDIPGLTKTDKNKLLNAVKKYPTIKAYADAVDVIAAKAMGYPQPGDNWLVGNISIDLNDALQSARADFLAEWKQNVDIIFSEKNINKIEAIYGPNFKEALLDSLWRMENGTNRRYGDNELVNNFMDWINGSIGTTMFLNMRSAVLQTLSTVNFINWHDNNVFKAAAAFANQPQFWTDFSMIFNSNWLRQRRSGLQHDVNANEMVKSIADARNPFRAAIGYLLKIGFKPTQIMDSFAIANGGATFYRNRVNTYKKQGLNQKQAEDKAFIDLQEIAEETQQSSRPDRISQQQASVLGKLILAFQNTPMQYMRLTKKAFRDLVNGRGDWKTNMSKIVYYSTVQNLIFYSLQSAMFALMFGDDEDEDKWEDTKNKKKIRTINGMLDTILRGTGVYGAVVSTAKNMIMKFVEQEKKGYYADHAYTLIEMLNLSPPIGIKARKLYSATQSWEFNRDVIKYMSKTDIDNPMYNSLFNLIEATTNVPLSRLYNKMKNVREALDDDNEAWQRVALFLGWNRWDLGIQDDEIMDIKNEISNIKKIEKEKKLLEKKYPGKSEEEIIRLEKGADIYKLNKDEQTKTLLDLGLDQNDINELKNEDDRVNKILEFHDNNPTKVDSLLQANKDYVAPIDKNKEKIKELYNYSKDEQEKTLLDLGLNDREISKLKKEEDRVYKILELYNKNPNKVDSILLKNEGYIKVKKKKRLTTEDKIYKLKKDQQVKTLLDLGIGNDEIKKLKTEKQRVDKILELRKDNRSKVDSVLSSNKDYAKPEVITVDKEKELKILQDKFLNDQKKEKETGKAWASIRCAALKSDGTTRCSRLIKTQGSNYCTIHEKVDQSKSGEKVRCSKIKDDGKQCKIKTSNKSGRCYYHD